MARNFETMRTSAKQILRQFWQGLREWCGDAAYERYARAHARHCCVAALLTREQFYLEELQKKYSRVSRCC